MSCPKVRPLFWAISFCFVIVASSSAEAACDFSGQWSWKQSNGPTVRVVIDQHMGTGRLRGTASIDARNGISGELNGRVRGRSVEMTVTWDNGQVGKYTGIVGGNSRPSGTGYSMSNPSSVTKWRSYDKVVRGC